MEFKDKMDWPDPPSGDVLYTSDSTMNILAQPTVNFSVSQSEWCGYKGECKKDMTNAWDICYLCKHMVKLDIPAMLEKAHGEQNK